MAKRKRSNSKRKKRRTHVPVVDPEGVPRSLVIKSGATGPTLTTLVRDFRRIMEPYTAIKLKERKSNKLKDFVHIAGQFKVSHLILFSRTEGGSTNLRVARLARGPTISFRVTSYALAKDVLKLQKNPRSPGSEFKTPPLVVLNGFGDDKKEVKLMVTMLQNMFPTIDVRKMRLSEARRVVLFNRDRETGEIEMRHYAIHVRAMGVSKSVKSILQANLPDLHAYSDISEFVLRASGASESDVEDAGESMVTVPTRTNKKRKIKQSASEQPQTEHRSIRLAELGPRLTLQLVKITEGLCGGEVLHHEHKVKSAVEVAAQLKRLELKMARRKEQEENVKRKQEAKSGQGDEEDDDDEDADNEDEDEDGLEMEMDGEIDDEEEEETDAEESEDDVEEGMEEDMEPENESENEDE
ncbi:Brix domain-containing protein [Cladochytrium replicatum]|nr:Brix domain-containing protein [Cladochytrium replicatum]